MSGILINVGSSSNDLNGRGRVFNDLTFEYLPIPETSITRKEVPTYAQLGFAHVKYPRKRAHLDPEFQTFTYGHVRRGFGDIERLVGLTRNDVLFFMATLQKEKDWSIYMIGYFRNLEVHDCRELSGKEILSKMSKLFSNNAHMKRVDPSVDVLVKGGQGSKLLEKVFPLAENNDHLALRKPLRKFIHTSTGKKITAGTPWYRWTLCCVRNERLLGLLNLRQPKVQY
ncbi:hypothetical protein MUP05_07005 [Candidatus Bathyarchaeota archaeon]|nr:hypothetical protein [Candidatus Bathyarchaeota archaeon]